VKGAFRIDLSGPEEEHWSTRILNSITPSGLLWIGQAGLGDTTGIRNGTSNDSFDLFLGDDHNPDPLSVVVSRFGHRLTGREFSSINQSVTCSASKYKAKWANASPDVPIATIDAVGTWGNIGLDRIDTSSLIGATTQRNIAGTMIGPVYKAQIDKLNPNVAEVTAEASIGFGTVRSSGLFVPPVGSAGVSLTHLYPHMDFLVEIVDSGAVSDSDVTYVHARRPHVWRSFGSEQEISHEGYRTYTGDFLQGYGNVRNPNSLQIGTAARAIIPDHPESPLYDLG